MRLRRVHAWGGCGGGLRWGLVALVGLALAADGHGAAPRYRPRPGSSSPIVTLTSGAAGPRAVEARMARFILSLQANDRVGASRLLSRRVGAARRRAFLRGKWLTRGSIADFAPVYFLPAIRVRARGISGPRAVVRVEPLIPVAPRNLPFGFIDVPMYREGGEWRINPASAAVSRIRSRPQKGLRREGGKV